MKNNMMKKLLTLVLAGAMTLSLAACGAKDPQPDSGTDGSTPRGFRVAIIKQLDHASLDEIANAVAAELDQLAQTEGVKIEYEITSGQGDQTILKQLADQAIADGVDAIVPIATTAAQIAALSAEETKTPVVYAAISDPETAKLTGIDYVTGTSDALNTEFIMDMMFAQNPNVAKVGLLYSLNEPNSAKPIAASMNRQTEFVQNASHELRTPLAIILAAQERLLAEPGARIVDRFEDVGAVADETKRLARLVDDLMTLTSAGASTEDEREAVPLEVSGIVEDVAGLYADVAEVAGKTLTVAVRPAGEVRIEADALRQVLGILLDNALKYTVAGDSVAVRCEGRGGRVTLSVADTGCGIDPADRGRVFERFYRADTARTTPGSGLGLSIARALVEHAGGVVAIEANEPRGTCVTVALPKARAR